MEVASFEFTLEHILRLHRGWITRLFVEEKKTEVEIVVLLHERKFTVTLEQIRKCLREWDLLSSPSVPAQRESEPDVRSLHTISNTELQIDTKSDSDGWEVINAQSLSYSNSPARLSSPSNLPFPPDSPTLSHSPGTASFPEEIERYKERPLPSIPTSTTTKKRRSSVTSLDRCRKDKLKLTCHHGPESHEVEMTLGILGKGAPPIETWAGDEQNHERIALALQGTTLPSNTDTDSVDLDDLEDLESMVYRKAGQQAKSGIRSRTMKGQKKRTRGEKKKEHESR